MEFPDAHLTLAALATLTATFAAAPAFASSYGSNNHGHSHGHTSHARSYGHGHVTSYNHHRPSYQAQAYHAPAYHAPTYVAPVYHAPKPTTTYETKPAYVYQKVSGTCTDKVVKYGYGHAQRTTVECKAGEVKKAEHVEKAPAPEQPLK